MYILVIDQGTSSTRAVLFNFKGQIIKFCALPLSASYPKPGWVEQSPDEIWTQVKKVLKEVCIGINPKQILACGITNQRETVLCWDKTTGACLSNAIVWQDRRTQEYCQYFENYQDLIRDKTGLSLSPYFSASKMNWLLKNLVIDKRQLKNLALGTMDSFLLWRLTHGASFKTDITNASRTLLYNIKEQKWDNNLLDLFEIPPHILPEVCDNDHEFGFLDKEFLGHSIPILAMMGDQQSALLGIGACNFGDVKATYGTGGFIMTHTGSNILQTPNLLTTVAYKINQKISYAQEGYINDAGSAIHWLKDKLGLIQDYTEAEFLASSVESSEGVSFIPSFSGLGPPYHLNTSGAFFSGLSRATTKAHLVRAVFDSILFQTKDIVSLLEQGLGQELINLKVDGGMADNHWFIKQLSGVLGKKILIPNMLENTAKGVALLAFSKLEDHQNIQSLSQNWQNYQEIWHVSEYENLHEYQNWINIIKNLSDKS